MSKGKMGESSNPTIYMPIIYKSDENGGNLALTFDIATSKLVRPLQV